MWLFHSLKTALKMLSESLALKALLIGVHWIKHYTNYRYNNNTVLCSFVAHSILHSAGRANRCILSTNVEYVTCCLLSIVWFLCFSNFEFILTSLFVGDVCRRLWWTANARLHLLSWGMKALIYVPANTTVVSHDEDGPNCARHHRCVLHVKVTISVVCQMSQN